MILNVLIKWGTTIKMLTSMLKNQQAFLNYFHQKKFGIDKNKKNSLTNIVNDYSFWKNLIVAKKILNSIHQIQYMSETEEHKLYTIVVNWNKIQSHLYAMTHETNDETNLNHIVTITWKNKYFNQIIKFHVIAVLLLPQNHVIKMIEMSFKLSFFIIMHDFFHRHFVSTDAVLVMKEWLAFHDQKDGFHTIFECWSYRKNLDLFWNFCKSFFSILNCIARKVMKLSVNSIMIEKS